MQGSFDSADASLSRNIDCGQDDNAAQDDISERLIDLCLQKFSAFIS